MRWPISTYCGATCSNRSIDQTIRRSRDAVSVGGWSFSLLFILIVNSGCISVAHNACNAQLNSHRGCNYPPHWMLLTEYVSIQINYHDLLIRTLMSKGRRQQSKWKPRWNYYRSLIDRVTMQFTNYYHLNVHSYYWIRIKRWCVCAFLLLVRSKVVDIMLSVFG